MIIDFGLQTDSVVNFEHVYQTGEIDLDDEFAQIAGATKINGVARQSTSETANVKGELKSVLEIACSRCLQLLETNFQTGFDVDYITLNAYEQVDAEEGPNDERGLTENDFSLSIYDGQRIDLDELTREQILLALPARQLCQENCAGLCEKCGVNKNITDCLCKTNEIDPRWNALRNLKSKN